MWIWDSYSRIETSKAELRKLEEINLRLMECSGYLEAQYIHIRR